jgi:hypothetical protein
MESKDQRQLLSSEIKFEFWSIPKCQEHTLAVFGSSRGIVVQERQQRKETVVTMGLEPQGLNLSCKIYAWERPMFSIHHIWKNVHES